MPRPTSQKPGRTSRGVSMGMNQEAPSLPQASKRAPKSELPSIDEAMKRFLAPVGSNSEWTPDEVYAPATSTGGFGEAPQAGFDSGTPAKVDSLDDAFAAALGLYAST
ncbi:MAG: hypothetical protein ACRC7G_08795, partial [Beijerinckiaceae bacterium]